MENFVAQAFRHGGVLRPLIIPSQETNGTALFNPSIYVDGDDVLVNVRHCQYTFYHSEKKKFEHEYGPLLYLNPENDITLTTTNYLCKLNSETYEIESHQKIDTSKLDVKPIWEFVGLEDGRLFRWDGKLYLCGVRRDTTPNGVGRMELSEIVNGKEVSRWRIPGPGKDDTYCEKNWMPILSKPYHFVKWCNPTEIVRVDPIKKTCQTVDLVDQTPAKRDYRGGSHVITVGKYNICLTHTVNLWFDEAGKKDAIYRHAFIVWDENWNIVKRTKEFSFMDADVEFCCGMAYHNGKILISFGYSDNAAFVLAVNADFVIDYILGDDGD